jgi:hypothetical protein
MNKKKELVKETKWLKVYRVGGKELRYDSKCLSEGLQISATSIKSTWATLTTDEQLEFAIAFGAIPKLSAEDEEILNFLMEAGSDALLSNLALQYSKHSDRERVLHFLLGRIKPLERPCANYYQALELLKDPRAVPILRGTYDEYRRTLKQGKLNTSELFDYLQCCRTLWLLGGSPEYENAIREMLLHPDDTVRQRAAQVLAVDKT